jgi:hypothetical protein
LELLNYPSQINGDNPNNVRHEASRHFKKERKEYRKDKTNELVTKKE